MMPLEWTRLWVFLYLCAVVGGVNVPAYELDALRDLYDSTNGTHWNWAPPISEVGTKTDTNGIAWIFSNVANPCTQNWQGINCTLSTTTPQTYHINKLVLVRHNLQGTLPPCIGNFSRMTYFNLDYNQLRGSLPTSITRLSQLRVLSLADNHFGGTVPQSYQALSQLQEIILNNNHLTGRFPNTLVSLVDLRLIGLENNALSGPIPAGISSLPQLTTLYLYNNHFTSTLPSTLCQLTELVELRVFNNSLAGQIPDCIGSLTNLNSLELYNNLLTGTIPSSVGSLTRLTIFYLHENHLTGTIPDTIGGMSGVLNFNVYRNRLTGTLPQSMQSFNLMTNIDLYYNYLSGSLSPMVGWSEVIFLYMQDNHFEGRLPVLTNLTKVTSLFVNNNKLSGSLEGVFDPIAQAHITTLQLSNNQFTSTLPDSLFQIAQLSTFAAVSNCFTGSLPLSICNSTSLSTLILDGLHSATSCRDNILPGVTNRYILEAKIEGGIPSCFFQVPALRTLHLSGNGITGSIAPDVTINSNLLDLSLSHNVLTGSIPLQFQSKRWYNLDLSYNKLTGSLNLNAEPFATNTTTLFYNTTLTTSSVALSLRNNRLSGRLPARLNELRNISVLDGNLFGCNIAQTDLPEHDNGRDTYQCGSNSFNVSYYIWVCMVAVVIIVAICGVCFRHYLSEKFHLERLIYYYDKWMHHIEFVHERDSVLGKDIALKNYKYLIYVCEGVCKVSAYCTLYILVILIPIYMIGSAYYSTHQFEYAWEVSAAFLSGRVATALLIVAFVTLLILAFSLFTIHIRRFLREKYEFFRYADDVVRRPSRVGSDLPTVEKTSKVPLFMKFCVYSIFFLINFTVVLGVNVAYVYVRLYQSSSLFVIAQLLLSVFKVVWNSFCSVYIIRWTDDFLTESSSDDWKSNESGFFAIQLFVALFNYIAIPCLVVGVISPDCYNSVLIEYDAVSSHYQFAECEVFSSVYGCVVSLPRVESTTYNPPFTYSYQCSSSMITFYAPSYVYLSFIVTFISPLLELVAEKWHARRVRGTFMAGQLDYWVPLILQTLEVQDEPTRAKYDIFNPYLDANLLLVTIITYLGVLLTFGVVFPPLSVCMLVAIISVVFNAKLTVGRFLTNAIDVGLHKYVEIIEGECQGAGSIPKLRQCMRLLLVFSFCFYTPFLFDTLGDSVGLGKSYWVIFFLPLLAAFGITIKYLMKKTFPDLLRVPEEQRLSHASRVSQYSRGSSISGASGGSGSGKNSNNSSSRCEGSIGSSSGSVIEMSATTTSRTASVENIEVAEQRSAPPRPSYLATPTASPIVTSGKKMEGTGGGGGASGSGSGGGGGGGGGTGIGGGVGNSSGGSDDGGETVVVNIIHRGGGYEV